MDQNRIDMSGFLEMMDQMCHTMRVAEDNMANQFTLQTDDELDPQLEAMTTPAHYLTASQSHIFFFTVKKVRLNRSTRSGLCKCSSHEDSMSIRAFVVKKYLCCTA